ncbi:hypothetical protein CL644_01800 [bacterium]|jgi:endonuclease/exonuclease/phosphatase family metal-dependent hydrolase|nr:hypothetical protein [Parcubacteria group bacterium]MBF05420.1 hypothetical protein [bacterium]|tara:strand:+ start:17956 stop:18684 length:729 start_codon:yes stop_codon:yes gene_type:complete
MKSLKVYSLNIQQSKHLHRFPQYIQSVNPDVVFLQEVAEHDALVIADMLKMKLVQWVPMANILRSEENYIWGLACYVTTDMEVVSCTYEPYVYLGEANTLVDSKNGVSNRYLQHLRVSEKGNMFDLLQTHFTWSPHGVAISDQERDMQKLLEILSEKKGFALFGDSNLPRGVNHLWDALAGLYVDNIPGTVKTTLDPVLHRVGHLQLMIDMCFTNGTYNAHDVAIQDGLSDHQGVFAKISLE